MNKLMQICEVLFVQEHWLNDDGLRRLQSDMEEVIIHGKSGMIDNELLLGRPYGGVGIIVKRTLVCSINPVNVDNSRIFACTIKLNGGPSLLLVNVYMPWEDHSLNFQNEFLNVLHNVDFIMSQFRDVVDGTIIGGDLNVDLTRTQSQHTVYLSNFCSDADLHHCALHSKSSVDFTFRSRVPPFSSATLDHFLVCDTLQREIVSFRVLHEGDNLSDHCPVILELNLSFVGSAMQPRTHVPRIAWHRAKEQDITDYRRVLTTLLTNVTLPRDAALCTDPATCTHATQLEEHATLIKAACMAAGWASIPRTRKKGVAGWTDMVKPSKERSIFWHRLWVQSGCQTDGELFRCMRAAKQEYKAAVRRVMRMQDGLSNARMAQAFAQHNSRNFWSEIKKKSRTVAMNPISVDNVEGNDEIGDLFRDKYDNLYNSVAYMEGEMSELKAVVTEQATSSCMTGQCYCCHSISTTEVVKAVKKLKRGKSGGNDAPSSDFFIDGSRELHIHVAVLLSACLRHAFFPEDLLLSTLIPIPKNTRKSLQDSDNYRSIAIGSILCKILDHVLIEKHAKVLSSSSMQFGFKAQHSTVMCSFVVQEVIEHYTSRGSDCHVLLLDASKAFDRIHFVKLFHLLINRGMCPMSVLLLVHMYTNQKLNVRWNSCNSGAFSCRNGVKQGGVLSPLLFCVYVDELLCRLQVLGVGCRIGRLFAGAFGYADDLTLLAPSIPAAKTLLKACEQFATDYFVSFNASKSQHLVCRARLADHNVFHPLRLHGHVIPQCDRSVLLGTCIGVDCHAKSIQKAAFDLVHRTNALAVWPLQF